MPWPQLPSLEHHAQNPPIAWQGASQEAGAKKRAPKSRGQRMPSDLRLQALPLMSQAHIWSGDEGSERSCKMTSPLARSTPDEARTLPDPASAQDHATVRGQEAKADDRARAQRLDAASRALAEARERRAAARAAELELAQAQKGEHNGRGGLDPVRYGDWEVKGIATDF
jgi:hypothetical protein